MYYLPAELGLIERRAARRRLRLALFLSAVMVAALIATLPIQIRQAPWPPASRVDVRLEQLPDRQANNPSPAATTGLLEEKQVEDVPANPAAEPEESRPQQDLPAPAASDWYLALERTAARSDEFIESQASLSPGLDERRRRAAEKFRASRAPVARPIWENVEMDQMGRKILRHKGCYRVIEDNAVTRRWVHDNFTQYMFFCDGADDAPAITMAFEPGRFDGYAYLTHSDGSAQGR